MNDDDLRFGDVSGGGGDSGGALDSLVEFAIKAFVAIVVLVALSRALLSILAIYLPDWVPFIGVVLPVV